MSKHTRTGSKRLAQLARTSDDRGKFFPNPNTGTTLYRSAGAFSGGSRTEAQSRNRKQREAFRVDASFRTTGLDGSQPAGRWEGGRGPIR